jgi:AraC family transcriptional activator of mtrCDE
MAIRSRRRPFDSIVTKTNVDDDADTGLVCGRFQFEQANHNTVLAALPPVIVVSAPGGGDAERIFTMIGMMRIELDEDRIGAAAVATALALGVMLIVMRTHLADASPRQDVLALLERNQTAQALLGMLNEPARAWTLDDLANRANTSRATLVRQFQATVNMAPVAFLAELRLTIARARIRTSRVPLAVIAEDVGYQSGTAFNRAYQRKFGVTPSADRSTL